MDAFVLDARLPFDAEPPPVDLFRPVDAPPPDVPGCVDADGDLHASMVCGGDDCDDADRLRFPGARERCQGLDDNCNGVVDEGSFVAAFIGAGSMSWRSFDLTCESTAAPTTPIETVVDVEALSRAYFFTATTYHVLDLLTRTWLSSGARSAIVPQTVGVPLLAGFSVPASVVGGTPFVEGVYLADATNIYYYELDYTSAAAPVFRFMPMFSDGRPNPVPWVAPPGLQTSYLDITGAWAPDSRAVCTMATYAAGPYSAFFTADRVLIDDSGSCFMRIADLPIASFGPFAYAGAPARTAWRHTLYNAGVWVFAAPRF